MQYGHQPIDREPAQPRVADARKIRGGDAGERLRLAHAQSPFIEHGDDVRGEDGAELLEFRVRQAKVAEQVAVALDGASSMMLLPRPVSGLALSGATPAATMVSALASSA
jgi:hypothetical protein